MVDCSIPRRQTASFKGIPFYAIAGGGDVGRRGAEGEFPFGEDAAYVDLGRKIRSYRLKARFAGSNYMRDSRAFMSACESPGPGELIHPTRGAVQVACRSAEFSEDYEQGDGVCEIDLDFVEANTGGGLSLSSIAGVSIGAGVSSLMGMLGAAWNMSAIPFFAVQDAQNFAAGALVAGYNAVASAIGTVPTLASVTTLSNLSIASSAPICLRAASNLTDLVGQIFDTIDSQAPNATIKFNAQLQMTNWAAQPAPENGASNAVNALLSTLRAVGAAYMARAAQETSVTTLDAALTQIAQIKTVLDEEISMAVAACDNVRHLTLRRLYAATVPPLYTQAYQTPPIVSYSLLGALPSLVAAWEIYGDATKFGTIEAMNPQSPCWGVGPKAYATKVST